MIKGSGDWWLIPVEARIQKSTWDEIYPDGHQSEMLMSENHFATAKSDVADRVWLL